MIVNIIHNIRCEYNKNAATWSLKTDPDYSNYIKVQGLSFQTC